MSSSISSSEPAQSWSRWLRAFLAALALGTALVFGFVIAIDPYDSGHFGFLGIEGVSDINANTGNASRARDPQFNAAIVGDSTAQPLKPSDLSALTGAHFVQLTVPGSGPREQLAMLTSFMRHHTHIEALVMSVGELWCSRDPALPPPHPFPFWLYGESKLEYAARLFSARALGRAWRRVLIGLGLRQRSRPDGYRDDAETAASRHFEPEISQSDPVPRFTGQVSDVFPAVRLLTSAIRLLPADASIVLFAPPVFYTHLPPAGGEAAANGDACKRALQDAIAGRARGNFIDYRVDSALSRDPTNFTDYVHTSAKGARQMERDIVERIRTGNNKS